MYDPCTVIALFHVVTAKILTFAIFQQIITTSDRQLWGSGAQNKTTCVSHFRGVSALGQAAGGTGSEYLKSLPKWGV